MKKLLIVSLVLAVVMSCICVVSTSAAEADTIVHSLLPAANDANGKVTTNNCDITYNADGSVTFTITGAGAKVDVVYVDGSTVYAGDTFNVREGAYVVFDYGSADGATLAQSTKAHYTRKDKEAAGTVADLWLTSMKDLTAYQKADGDGFGIWSLGDYLVKEKGDACIFEDNMHRFTSLELYLEGPKGSSVTVYRFYVGTADAVEGLGTVRPEKVETPEVSEPATDVPEITVPEGAVNYGKVSLNTSIVAGAITFVTDPAVMQNYNVKWTSCALLRPTETEGEYEVVAVQWLNGDDTFLFADAAEGDVVLSVHSDPTVEGSDANKAALDALKAGDIVYAPGYNFADMTAADNAVVYLLPAEADDEVSETPDDESVTDESTPADESEKADESVADTSVADTSKDDSEKGGKLGLILGIAGGVVAVAVIVVVVIVVAKKKK